MKCPKCKKKLPKNTKFCSNYGTQIKKKSFKVIAIVLAIVILLCSVGIVGYKLNFFDLGNNKYQNGDFLALNYKFTNKKITSAEEAIDAVSEISDTLGFDNALDELTVQKVDSTVDSDGFFRLQQNYKGIPVYGRTVVIASSKEGNALSLNSNVKDIKTNVDVEPQITQSEIENQITNYITDNYGVADDIYIPECSTNDLILFNLYNYEDILCYKINIVFSNDNIINSNELFVDTKSGEIILENPLVVYDNDEYSNSNSNMKGQKNDYSNISVSKKDNVNYLYDMNRNMEVFKAKNKLEQGWSLDIFASGTIKGIFTFANVWNDEEEISWNVGTDLTEKNEADLYVNLQKSYDYFDKILGNTSTDGDGKATILGLTNIEHSKYTNENDKEIFKSLFDNADSSSNTNPSNGDLYTLIRVGNTIDNKYTFSAYLDVIGHEYTHGVNRFHNNLIYSGESGAIDEALADIFGELIEASNNTTLDWFHGTSRNIKNPTQKKQPNYYKGKFWTDTSNLSDDKGGVHQNSTVLSHSAYLMWYGIDGDSKKNLNETELAELWYRSLLMLPADASFADCRTIVEMSAEQIGLSNHQKKCVSEAFDKVGIGRTDNITYLVKNNFDLTVNDVNGIAYDKYTLSLDNDRTIDNISVPQSIELQDGVHTLTIKDKEDENKTYSFTVNISHSDEARDYVNINSDFGKLEDETKEEENINKEITIDPSYPTTYDESSMKYQRMVAKDENYTFMKDLNGKLERKNNDGSAGDKVLYDKEFFTICGIDASYIYLLKGSEKDGVYDIVRISKDGKKTDTLLQSINWCLHMDSDYFYYVPSDNNKCIRRLNRAKITSDNYCEFNEPVEVLIPQDNNFMVVTKEDSIFAFFGGATNNFYLIDKNGATIKEYGSEITVEEYPREKNDEGGYNTAIKYVSNGYLRSTAAEVHLQYGGSFINAEGISGWNPTKNGVVTTLNNDADGENALPYKVMLYDATSGVSKKMTEVHSNQAFFTMCQDDNGNWSYIDEVENKLILYSLSSDFGSKEIITEIDAGKFNCSLETCGMEIMDNRIYFYSMPDNRTANAIYRYDLILED